MKLKILINQLLGLVGFHMSRLHTLVDSDFFVQDPTCQIPYLGFLYETVFDKKSSGCVVEVGAYDGQYLSNSSCLIEKNWKAVLIEPIPHLAEACRSRYTRNDNVIVCELAIGSSSGTSQITYMDTMSSMSVALTEEYKTKRWAKQSLRASKELDIILDTLNNVLEKNGISPAFDVLIVDVEGMESEVFKGFDLDFWKPKMLIIELSDFHPDLKTGREDSHRLYQQILLADYYVIYKDHINTIFVHRD